MLDIVACILGWFIIASQVWSIKFHFNVQKMPPGARLISALVIASAVFLTYMTLQFSQPVRPQWVGLAILVFSCLLFWRTIQESKKAKLLAAFDENLPHGLLTTGPYRFVRHPFYTSYILHWLGWAIVAWNIWAIIPVVAMFTTYWVAARDEEAKFSRTEMSASYEEYRSKTGRFFPKIWG